MFRDLVQLWRMKWIKGWKQEKDRLYDSRKAI